MRCGVSGYEGQVTSSGDQEAVMSRILRGENLLQKSVVLLLGLVIPALAWGQHKTSAPAPKAAPAQHASAPAHSSAPSHANTQSHTSTPSHTGSTAHTRTTTHAGTTTHTSTTTHTTTTTHTATTSHSVPGRNVSLKGGGHASIRPNG